MTIASSTWDDVGCEPTKPSPPPPDLPASRHETGLSRNASPHTQPKELYLEPLGELLAKPEVPVNYTVEGLLAAGSVSLIVAKPKVGKSTLARCLSVSIARGEPFLGRKTKQGAVIYLVLEERPEDVVAGFRSMGATADDPIQIATRADVSAMVTTLRKLRPVLLVVDPLFRLITARDEKGYAEIYGCMAPLIDVARETETHIACLHHSPKQAREDAIDSPLGSTALGGAVSTLLELRRNPETQQRTVRSTQRVGQDLDEMVIRFDAGTCRLRLDGTRKEFEIANLKPAIWAVLSETTPLTENQLFDLVEHGKTGPKRTALRSLLKDGVVQRSGGGKRGDPYLYKKARSHVPDLIGNNGNEKPPKADIPCSEKVVPSSSLLYGNERNELFCPSEVVASAAEILVPTEIENRAISITKGNEHFPASSQVASHNGTAYNQSPNRQSAQTVSSFGNALEGEV